MMKNKIKLDIDFVVNMYAIFFNKYIFFKQIWYYF